MPVHGLFSLVVVCASLVGCGGPPPTGPEVPVIDVDAAVAAAMAQYDSDGNGSLAESELTASPPLAEALSRFDQDGDGAISSDEFAARLTNYNEAGLALYSYSCRVLLDGRPLPGATVKLVPERFLGEAAKVATGTTNENGTALPVIDEEKLQGVHAGLYRVEITKEGGQAVPARYNTASQLSQEVAPGVRSAEGGGVFELRSQ